MQNPYKCVKFPKKFKTRINQIKNCVAICCLGYKPFDKIYFVVYGVIDLNSITKMEKMKIYWQVCRYAKTAVLYILRKQLCYLT